MSKYKMSKYKCGADVREGDTVERIEPSLSLVVGDNYEVSIPSLSCGYISVVGCTVMVYDPLFFKLIKRKQKPKLVWKEMTLEEVKAVQVGDKIRIDGVEDEVILTFNKVKDFGFRTKGKRKHYNYDNDTDIVCCDAVAGMEYKFEHLVEETEMNTRLERDKEYDVRLTGEEIAWLQFASARGNTSGSLYKALRNQFGELKGIPESKTNGQAWDHIYRGSINAWYDELFPKPETEDQRKLRELKEQYESLGKAIDAMEKK